MNKPHKLLWLDVETTGLDHTLGDILEIGATLTTLQGEQEDHWSTVIKHDPQIIETALANGNKTALAMHSRNGLLWESLLGDDAITRREASFQLRCRLTEWTEEATLHPAGTNVDFDLTWLKAKLPECDPLMNLSHRHEDLTSLRIIAMSNGYDPYITGHNPDDPHRVKDCIRRDISEYKMLRNHTTNLTYPTKEQQ